MLVVEREGGRGKERERGRERRGERERIQREGSGNYQLNVCTETLTRGQLSHGVT